MTERMAHRAIRREMGARWFYQRIEHVVDVPDIYFVYRGHMGWIELKAATDTGVVAIRPGQINWIVRHGPGAYLVIRRVDGKGRHIGWLGMTSRQVVVLRHLRRPTLNVLLGTDHIYRVTFLDLLESMLQADRL